MDTLSSRGVRACQPLTSYFDLADKAGSDKFDPVTNPDGYINFAVAQNVLSFSSFKEKLESISKTAEREHYLSEYNNMKGIAPLREALAKCVTNLFKPAVPIHADGFVVSAGCGAILNNLMFSLCEAGDVCLIPAPYYPAFDNDLKVQAGVIPVAVPSQPPAFFVTRESLEATYQSCIEKGQKVKVVLISNPSNPLGRCYTKEEVHTLVSFCLEKKIHLISDEIYAHSIYGENAPELRSILTECTAFDTGSENGAGLGPYLHFVWGMSKDFGVSGFRIGVLYTENKALLKALDNVSYFCAVSNWHQQELALLLSDSEFVESYLAHNTLRLREAYQRVERMLLDLSIPFLPAHAGMFVWIDLRSWLSQEAGSPAPESYTFGDESKLFRSLFAEERILFTPGESCHSAVPGFFRICFAAVLPEAVAAALQRLKSRLQRRGVALSQ
eukprot:GILI01029342.1.p1 GENE.GILI01029342.1~~GILI01029342.1.p1  ORF type:complete len:443 (+),score=113.41 GILI01029342.1:46-1374(+)